MAKPLTTCSYSARYYHASWALFDYALSGFGPAESNGPLPDDLWASLLNARGYLGMHMGQYQQAQTDLEASLALAHDTMLTPQIGNTLGHLAYLWIQINRFSEARKCLEQGLTIAKEQADVCLEASALRMLGITAWGEGDVNQAIQHTQQSRALAQSAGELFGAAASLNNLGQFFTGLWGL